jgi:nucleoside-diphosphate-sugar epimerase
MQNSHSIHTVLGAGPVAKATVAALLSRGLPVRVVHRSGTFAKQLGVEVVAADTTNLAQLTQAFKDSTVVYMCAMPAYHHWAEEFDAMMLNILQACAANGSAMVFADNLYMYQESPNAPMSENTPLKPATRKGVVRARIAEMVMQAHRDGKVKSPERPTFLVRMLKMRCWATGFSLNSLPVKPCNGLATRTCRTASPMCRILARLWLN